MRQASTLIFLSGLLFTVTGCGSVDNSSQPTTSSTPITVNTSTVVTTPSPIIVPTTTIAVTSTTNTTTDSINFLKRIENISKALKEKGIANKYKNISESMDVGARYVFTFETSLSDYKLFV